VKLLIFLLFSFSALGAYTPSKKLKLYAFNCGDIITGPLLALFTRKYQDLWAPKKEWISTCFLIRHPKGDLLWDTGLDDNYAHLKKGKSFFFGLTIHKVKTPLIENLNKLGILPKNIKFVGISHLHEDHTGNVRHFVNSKILIQEEEKKAAFSLFPSTYFFKFEHYKNLNDQIVGLKGDHDVFGDGKVMIIKAPGHTPGHQVLLVRLKQSGAFILAGDLYHTNFNRETKVIPFFVTHDGQNLKQSIEKVENLRKKEKAKLWIQHEPTHYKKALKPPLYYD